MKRISFVDMQSIIENVVRNVMKYGHGYKQFFIDYNTSKFYGNANFGAEDVEKIYDENYEVLVGAKNNADPDQYYTIIKAIDDEIDRRTKFACAEAVMSDANAAVANLANDISSVVKSFNDSINVDEVKQIMEVLAQIKDKVDSDSLVKAMVDNGLVSMDKNTSNDNSEMGHNIEVITNSDKDGV